MIEYMLYLIDLCVAFSCFGCCFYLCWLIVCVMLYWVDDHFGWLIVCVVAIGTRWKKPMHVICYMLNGKNRVQPERQWSSVPEYQGTSGWMNRWMSGAVCRRMDGWTNGLADTWTSGWAEQCASGWMDQQMGGWVDECAGRLTVHQRICSAPASGDLQAGNLQTVISKQARRWSLTFVTGQNRVLL
jgi:hypothetical protein